jgi:hypothetical protein
MANRPSGRPMGKDEDVQLFAGHQELKKFAKLFLARKIMALVGVSGFDSKISWIAKKLGAELDEVQEAIDFLELNNILKWTDAGLVQTQPNMKIDYSNRTKEDLAMDHRMFSMQLYNQMDAENRFFVYNLIYATDEKTFTEFHNKINAAKEWFIEESMKSSKNMLVAFSVGASNQLKKNK